MSTSVWTEPRRVGRFSFLGFNAFTFAILIAFLASFRLLLPTVWEGQFNQGLLGIALVFVVMSLSNCFAEWGFHRYMLHLLRMRIIFMRFAENHELHHALTDIVRIDPDNTGGAARIINCLPITKEFQHKAAAFPIYALPAFLFAFTLELLPLQLLLPNYPVLLGGYLAVYFSYSGYENWHAIEHLPLEWWEERMASPRFGKFWKIAYGHHLGHHAITRTNLNVWGFFGYPLADKILGTLVRWLELPLNGRLATAAEFAAPKPRWPIPWLDRMAERLVQLRMSKQPIAN